jgi:hypothetical protein
MGHNHISTTNQRGGNTCRRGMEPQMDRKSQKVLATQMSPRRMCASKNKTKNNTGLQMGAFDPRTIV